MALDVRKMHPLFVAEVTGVNITEPLTSEIQSELQSLIDRHGILVFRDQNFTDEQQVALSQYFGEIEIANNKTNITKQEDRRLSNMFADISNLNKNDELHEQLSPHILLPETAPKDLNRFPKWEKKKYEKRVRKYPKVDINKADTASFKALYGIGDFLADMIVKRREELGGFISKDQLKEVYGLKEETLIRLDT